MMQSVVAGEPRLEPVAQGYTTWCDPCFARRKPPPAPPPTNKIPLPKAQTEDGAATVDLAFEPPKGAAQLGSPSPAPLLQRRFTTRTIEDLQEEHEGAPAGLEAHAAQERLDKGWKPGAEQKFRENEAFMQTIFGDRWDGRYGRTRVKSAETGQVLCWGDGETLYDAPEPRDAVDTAVRPHPPTVSSLRSLGQAAVAVSRLSPRGPSTTVRFGLVRGDGDASPTDAKPMHMPFPLSTARPSAERSMSWAASPRLQTNGGPATHTISSGSTSGQLSGFQVAALRPGAALAQISPEVSPEMSPEMSLEEVDGEFGLFLPKATGATRGQHGSTQHGYALHD